MTAPMDVLANAFNCAQAELVAYPQATIDAEPVLSKVFGARLVAIESVPAGIARRALAAYASKTDWSAFTRADWQAAVAALGGAQ